jgi:hypothetical protein
VPCDVLISYPADSVRGELGVSSFSFRGSIDDRFGKTVEDLTHFLESTMDRLDAERRAKARWVVAKVDVGDDGRVTLTPESHGEGAPAVLAIDRQQTTDAVLGLLREEKGHTVKVYGIVSGAKIGVAGLLVRNDGLGNLPVTLEPSGPRVDSVRPGQSFLVTRRIAEGDHVLYQTFAQGHEGGYVNGASVNVVTLDANHPTPPAGSRANLAEAAREIAVAADEIAAASGNIAAAHQEITAARQEIAAATAELAAASAPSTGPRQGLSDALTDSVDGQ